MQNFQKLTFSGVIAFLGSACCIAAPLTLPQGVPALPDIVTEAKSGVIIDSGSFEPFTSLLVPELLSFVRNGELTFEAALAVEGQDLLDPEWIVRSQSSLVHDDLLGEWDRKAFPPSSYLFAPDRYKQFPKSLGHRILWNSVAHLWSEKNIKADFSLFLIKERNRPRRLSLSVERVYPENLGLGKTPQIFREKLTLQAPAALSGLTWLTFRFLGEEEDAVWVLSPSIRKVREVTGTNRGDEIFSGAFAADDIFVLSSKLENVEIKSVERQVRFVPFSKPVRTPLSAPDERGCRHTSKIQGTSADWNFETDLFKNAAPWIPVNVVFVPRNVFRIEYSVKDPFALSAHEIVYIDEDLHTPFLRASISRIGEVRKLVIGVVGGFEEEGGRGLFPIIKNAAVIFKTGDRALLSVSKFEACEKSQGIFALDQFDPNALRLPAVDKPEPGEPKKKVTAQASTEVQKIEQ